MIGKNNVLLYKYHDIIMTLNLKFIFEFITISRDN